MNEDDNLYDITDLLNARARSAGMQSYQEYLEEEYGFNPCEDPLAFAKGLWVALLISGVIWGAIAYAIVRWVA